MTVNTSGLREANTATNQAIPALEREAEHTCSIGLFNENDIVIENTVSALTGSVNYVHGLVVNVPLSFFGILTISEECEGSYSDYPWCFGGWKWGGAIPLE